MIVWRMESTHSQPKLMSEYEEVSGLQITLYKSALATLSSDRYDGVEKGVYTHPQLTTKKLGYKLVGDNIDKTVKSRYIRTCTCRLNGHPNKSFHFFAVQNRIDISIVQVHVLLI